MMFPNLYVREMVSKITKDKSIERLFGELELGFQAYSYLLDGSPIWQHHLSDRSNSLSHYQVIEFVSQLDPKMLEVTVKLFDFESHVFYAPSRKGHNFHKIALRGFIDPFGRAFKIFGLCSARNMRRNPY